MERLRYWMDVRGCARPLACGTRGEQADGSGRSGTGLPNYGQQDGDVLKRCERRRLMQGCLVALRVLTRLYVYRGVGGCIEGVSLRWAADAVMSSSNLQCTNVRSRRSSTSTAHPQRFRYKSGPIRPFSLALLLLYCLLRDAFYPLSNCIQFQTSNPLFLLLLLPRLYFGILQPARRQANKHPSMHVAASSQRHFILQPPEKAIVHI